MTEPLVLEDWELVYLKDAVASNIKRFSGLLNAQGSEAPGEEAIKTVIENYQQLQAKLEAASGDKE